MIRYLLACLVFAFGLVAFIVGRFYIRELCFRLYRRRLKTKRSVIKNVRK